MGGKAGRGMGGEGGRPAGGGQAKRGCGAGGNGDEEVGEGDGGGASGGRRNEEEGAVVKEGQVVRRGSGVHGGGLFEEKEVEDARPRKLAEHGWTSMVRIRDDDEEIHIYFKDQGGEMVGLTVLSLEEDEAMLINLVGRIDPTGLGSLANSLDLPQLEQAAQNAGEDN